MAQHGNIDDVVGFQRVGLGGELDVERGELMPVTSFKDANADMSVIFSASSASEPCILEDMCSSRQVTLCRE